MKTILTSICAVAFIFSGATFAAGQYKNPDKTSDKSSASNQSKEIQQNTKTTTESGTAKMSTHTVYGRVESYDTGKSLKVTVPGKISSTTTFDLNAKDTTADVASNIKTGEWVRVTEKTDNNGHKTITVRPSSEKHATRMKHQSQ